MKPRTLICSCCGAYAKGRQWPNRDTGYGLCPECADWIGKRGTDAEEMRRLYGERGVHYGIKEQTQ